MVLLLLLPLGAIAIPILSLLSGRRGFLGYLAVTVLGSGLVLNFLPQFSAGGVSSLFELDGIARFFNFIFLSVALLVGIFCLHKNSRRAGIFYTMLLSGTSAMMFIASSKNLIGIFLGLEILSLSFYELCALKKDALGLESAAKLFFTSIFGSALFVLGAVLAYSVTQSFELIQFLTPVADPVFLAGLALLFAGIGFKMSIFPFNFWLPDVYQGAPSEITALLAASAKKAGFAAFLRLFLPIFKGAPFFLMPASGLVAAFSDRGWFLVLAVASLLTMTFGNITAALQNNVKRMISYSIIAHAGFIMIGLASATALGFLGFFFHIFVHAFMATGVFLSIAILTGKGLESFADYDGLGRRNPFLAVLFTVFLASLTGIPPLAGFLSKFILWSSAVEVGWTWLGVAAIINSAISTYFYFLILRHIWGSGANIQEPIPVSWNEKLAITLPAAAIIFFGLYPEPVLEVLRGVAYELVQ